MPPATNQRRIADAVHPAAAAAATAAAAAVCLASIVVGLVFGVVVVVVIAVVVVVVVVRERRRRKRKESAKSEAASAINHGEPIRMNDLLLAVALASWLAGCEAPASEAPGSPTSDCRQIPSAGAKIYHPLNKMHARGFQLASTFGTLFLALLVRGCRLKARPFRPGALSLDELLVASARELATSDLGPEHSGCSRRLSADSIVINNLERRQQQQRRRRQRFRRLSGRSLNSSIKWARAPPAAAAASYLLLFI